MGFFLLSNFILLIKALQFQILGFLGFLGFLTSFFASTCRQCTGFTCFRTVTASACGAVLTPLLTLLNQRSPQNTSYGGRVCRMAANSHFHTTLWEISAPRASSKHSSAFQCIPLSAAHSALIIRTWSLQQRWMLWHMLFCIQLLMNHCSCHTIPIITAFLDLWLIVLAEEKKNQQKMEGTKSGILEIKITSCLLLLEVVPFRSEPICTHMCTHCFLCSTVPGVVCLVLNWPK